MSRTILAGVAATLMSAVPTLAADAFDTPVPFTWSGAYVGVTAGVTMTQADVELGTVNGDLLNFDVEQGLFLPTLEDRDIDFTIGARAGIDMQVGGLTFGVRGTVEKLGNGSASSHAAIDGNPLPLFNGLDTRSKFTTDMDVVLTAEALVGYALGRTRAYVTGGVAAAKITNTFDLDLVPMQPGNLAYSNSFEKEDWRHGYTVGAGVERAFTDRLSASFEYRYYDFENVTVRAIDPPNFGDNFMDYEFSNRGHVATLGLNVRF